MEFRALGSVSVRRNGVEADLGAPKQRSVIALLLMHHNSVLSFDRIIDELWPDDGDGKLNALRVHVSRLRSALDPDRARGERSVLETVGSGYRLNVEPDQFDAIRFEVMAARGRELLASDPAAAASMLRSAIGLWTGRAFEDVADEEFALVESRRLEQARIDALEDRIEADLALGVAGEVVSELELLREQCPLRERPVEQLVLALYRSGRPADALRAIDRFRRYVGEELGVDPSPRLLRLEEQVLLHDERIQPRAPAADRLTGPKRPATNPFKGLRPFGVDDATSFFGRDALVAELLRSIQRGQRLVALVGTSGSGKSSVVRAGLMPALAKAAIEGSDRWLVASMMPGAHPFAEIEAALLRTRMDAPASLTEQLTGDDAGLVRASRRILPDDDSRLVLIIDQFEELFTLVDDPSVRERFLSNIVTAVDDPHRRITVVITLRADFYGQQLTHPEFGARLGSGVVNVTAMTAEELEAAALRPAEEQGVAFEPALLGRLIADVGTQPGSLPLFQFTLTELFDRRASDTLAVASYRSMGGIDGALQRRASALYDELDRPQQEAARQLFLRLVVVGDDDQRSRRRVAAREVVSLAVDTIAMQQVIERFGQHRLLSFDSDRLTGAPTVEVAHEALLTAWPALEQWIDESRDDLRRHASLATALREWQLAGEHDEYLLTSARVSEFEGWAATSVLSLNQSENAFLDASTARIAELEAEAKRRRLDDARARRRLWGLVGALGVTLGVAGLFLFGVVGGAAEPTVTFFGNRTDEGWNANIASGLDRASRDLGVEVVDVPWVVDPGAELRELAASGPEYVVTDGFGISFDPAVVVDFPDVRFGIVDDTLPGSSVAAVMFANEEGAYLAGAAAAMKTETRTVGFLGGSHIGAIDQFQAGFEAGVRSVDPGIAILVAYVDQFGELGTGGFTSPEIGADRARALYERDADVVFAAAGYSGWGAFDVVVEESELAGRHLWVIGVDNDQWFDAAPDQRPHVLTSIIKRGDVAAYELVKHMIGDETPGTILRLGLADGGFTYSQQGNGLTQEMIVALDRFSDDIGAGRIDVPLVPTVPVLLVDSDGNEIDGPAGDDSSGPELGVDGFDGGLAEPGTYELAALGTSLTLTLDEPWLVPVNVLGETVFAHPDSQRAGDRDVVFLRPHGLADPTKPYAALEDQEPWPVDDIEGWLDRLVDGIDASEAARVEIGDRSAVYFEVELADRMLCGKFGFCAGFLANTIDDDGSISGWAFEPGYHQRIWWVGQGAERPLVIIASTPVDDRSHQAAADALLATLQIGNPRPHPVPFEESGLSG